MSTTASATASPSRGLHIGLWVAQGLLALAFTGAGFTKLLTPIAELAPQMGWVLDVPEGLVRFIGASELAGAAGLILPSALRIQPRLTVWAAIGLVTVMVLASGTHASRGEFGVIGANVMLGGLAAFVAWGRSKGAPISA